jgi:hypothetical protein
MVTKICVKHFTYSFKKVKVTLIYISNFYLALCADKIADLALLNANFYLALCADKIADFSYAKMQIFIWRYALIK